MLSLDLYQLLKDVLTAPEAKRAKLLSADQIDLTFKEIDRLLGVDLRAVEACRTEAKNNIDADLARRGFFKSTMRTAGHAKVDAQHDEQKEDLMQRATYVKKMLELERAKLVEGALPVGA